MRRDDRHATGLANGASNGLPAAQGRHCVVGAGVSGLAMAKALGDSGVTYDLLECNDAIGGNWYEGVYDSVRTISSRDTSGYDDFPMPEDWPTFLSRDQMLTYLNRYADAHDIHRHVQLRSEVERIEPLGQRGMGGWRVTLGNGKAKDYAGVVVCNGHHWAKRFPPPAGNYTGHGVHSKDYRRPSDLRGDTVLVVGAGNSGCDIAAEAARNGKRTVVSQRRSTYMLPKAIGGVPTSDIERGWMPRFLQKGLLHLMVLMTVGPHSHYGLSRPKHGIFEQDVTVNTQLLSELHNGRIEVRPAIDHIDGRRVRFVDGTQLDADTIVWATGFDVRFPFLDERMLEWDTALKCPRLVARVLPPGWANLYLFGLGQPRGGAGPYVSCNAPVVARMIGTQRGLDRPLSDELIRHCKPTGRVLWGATEIRRRIKREDRAVRRVARRRGNGGPAPITPESLPAESTRSGRRRRALHAHTTEP